MDDKAEVSNNEKERGRIDPFEASRLIKIADEKLCRTWRVEAYKCYEMYAGYQWPEQDRLRMQAERRPTATFNRVGPLIDATVGIELSNRMEVKFYPRTPRGDVTADVMNGVARWVYNESGLRPAEIDQMKDMFICGMGVLSTRMNYDDSEDGTLDIERFSPLDFRWDNNARNRNITDTKWRSRKKIMTRGEIKDVWPDVNVDELTDSEFADEGMRDKIVTDPPRYTEKDSDGRQNVKKGIPVWQFEYYRLEPYYKLNNPFLDMDPQWVQLIMPDLIELFGEDAQKPAMNLTEEGLTALKDILKDMDAEPIKPVRLNKKVFYKLFFAQGVEFQHTENAVQAFTLTAVTGKRDEKTGGWYGIMRAVYDPQQYANKLFSTILYTFINDSKGGVMVGQGGVAIENMEEFKQQWAAMDGVLEVLDISKIQPKPKSGISPAAEGIMRYSIEALTATTGINPEFLSVATQNRSAALADSRVKQTTSLLLDTSENITLGRLEVGHLIFLFTKDYLAQEERVIRLTDNQNAAQFVTLIADDLASEYDVVVEEGATTTDQKAQNWKVLSEIYAGQGIPAPLWKYAPVPPQLANEIMAYEQQKTQPSPEQQAMQQAQIAGLQADAEKSRALAANTNARTGKVIADTEKTKIENTKAHVDGLLGNISNAMGNL